MPAVDVAQRDVAQRIEDVRRFNRFYTRKIGVLQEAYLETPFSLTEARILYELAQRQTPTASELCKALELDAGYLSRILRGFEQRGFISKSRSASDARQSLIVLTDEGREAFAPLDRRSRDTVGALLEDLPPEGQSKFVDSLKTIERLLGERIDQSKAPYLLRPHRPGDMGWIVHRHGVLLNREYGWDLRFEALVAEIVAEFIRRFDPARECCWIAERDGEIVGSVFVVRNSESVAKLRLLLVEPGARGLGIGRRLVEECIRFARQAGYRSLTLWTQDVLQAARHIYTATGFQPVDQKRHSDFGPEIVGETWELTL